MKAILVAGGKGERLKPITDKIPKPMVKVKNKPILQHIIELFKKNGTNEFIIALCYKPEVVTKYFGTGEKFGVKIDYIYEDPSHPLGTAGAIASAKKFIRGDFIVTYADILRDLDIKTMIAQHRQTKAFATINAYKRVSLDAKSMVLLKSNNQVQNFIERPKPEQITKSHIWVNGSFYIFNKSIFDFIPQNTPSDFGKDIFPIILKENKSIFAFPTEGFFIDIGNLDKLEKARTTFKPT